MSGHGPPTWWPLVWWGLYAAAGSRAGPPPGLKLSSPPISWWCHCWACFSSLWLAARHRCSPQGSCWRRQRKGGASIYPTGLVLSGVMGKGEQFPVNRHTPCPHSRPSVKVKICHLSPATGLRKKHCALWNAATRSGGKKTTLPQIQWQNTNLIKTEKQVWKVTRKADHLRKANRLTLTW